MLFSVFSVLVLSEGFTAYAKGKPSPVVPTPIPNSICIDPGHGGSEPGAINGDLIEKNVNLEVAKMLRDKLLDSGSYTVFMTRDTDVYLTNADRYNFCNLMNAEILISIHHNGSEDPGINYSTAFYMKRSDVALAQEVVNTVSSTLGLTNKGISRFASGVLLKSVMPATISEGFFLTSSAEYENIANSDRLEQEADALFVAITNYLK